MKASLEFLMFCHTLFTLSDIFRMLPQLTMSSKRTKLEWVRKLSLGFGLAFLFQTLFTLIHLESNQSRLVLDFLLLSIVLSGFLITKFTYTYKIGKGSMLLHEEIKTWVNLRYDLEFDNKQVKILATPSKVKMTDVEGYCSEKIVLWHKDEYGQAHAINVRLFKVENEWILFSSDLGEELPLKIRKELESQEKEFFVDMWDEVREAGGFYSIVGTENTGFISGVKNDKLILLFWSDTLRLQLWVNSQKEIADYKIIFVPIESFRSSILEQVKKDHQLIGLNWDEKRRYFNPEYIESLID